MSFHVHFFFFQAEDGIRDKLVTGVQTCALPISSTREAIAPLAWLAARALVLGDARYARAWTERAGQVSRDLRRLSEYAVSQWEALHLREASVAFEGYRRIVATEGALLQRGERGQALR